MKKVLLVLWKEFCRSSLNLLLIPNGKFAHLGTSGELLELFQSQCQYQSQPYPQTTDNYLTEHSLNTQYYRGEKFIYSSSSLSVKSKVDDAYYAIASFINEDAIHTPTPTATTTVEKEKEGVKFFEYSILMSPSEPLFSTTKTLIFSHLPAAVSSLLSSSFPGMMLQFVPISSPHQSTKGNTSPPLYALSVLAVDDNIKSSVNDRNATIGGVQWQQFLQVFSLSIEDIWSHDDVEKTLWTARLFPVTDIRTLRDIGSDANAFFLIRALSAVHANSEDIIADLRSRIEAWKSSDRISLADILGLSDNDSMLSWRSLMSSAYRLELFEGSSEGFGQFMEDVYDGWRRYSSLIRQLISTADGSLPFTLEVSAVALLYLFSYQHFFPLTELLHTPSDPSKANEEATFGFLSKLFAPLTCKKEDLYQVISAAKEFIVCVVTGSTKSPPYDYSSKLQLVTAFLQNLITQDHHLLAIASALFEVGKLLPSNQQPRILFLIACLLKTLSKHTEKVIQYHLMAPKRREELMDLMTYHQPPLSFEGKLQLLYRHIFLHVAKQLLSLSDPTSIVDIKHGTVSADREHIKGLSIFVEDLTQLLIQYHLSLSITEKLFGSNIDSSSSPSASSKYDPLTASMKLKAIGTEANPTLRVSFASCPVRIDIMGGWSDTPPICYDQGGKVLNVAVKVNHKNPMRCVSRFLPGDGKIVLRCYQRASDNEIQETANATSSSHGLAVFGHEEINNWRDLVKVHHSSSPCALLKACLIALGWNEDLQRGSSCTLSEYLISMHDGGIEISCISDLPAGSGMGGSSILAATILASLSHLFQLDMPRSLLMDYVGYVEQILTTGGGWQDQIGGAFGGFKLTQSLSSLPLHLKIQSYIISHPLFLQRFEERACLIYSGKQRLAKNTLINALRKYSITCGSDQTTRRSHSTSNASVVDQLIVQAEEGERELQQYIQLMETAVNEEALLNVIDDLIDHIGGLMNRYWHLKIQMAKGSNPPLIASILKSIKPLTVGLELAGAGGGGFVVVLLQNHVKKEEIEKKVQEINTNEQYKALGEVKLYDVSIDNEGLKVEDISQKDVMMSIDEVERLLSSN